VYYLNKLQERGHELIVNTCRHHSGLIDCKQLLRVAKLNYSYINENHPRLIYVYGDTRKIGADVYIDDKGIYFKRNWKRIYKQILKKEKPIVLCLSGASGTGKSTIADWLEAYFGITNIKSYTTRPRRDDSENSHTFVSENQMTNKINNEPPVAETIYGNHRYAAFKSQFKRFNVYVIDDTGIEMLMKEYSGEFDIYTMRIKSSPRESVSKERMERDKDMIFIKDEHFDAVIKNDDLFQTLQDIERFLVKNRLLKRIVDNTSYRKFNRRFEMFEIENDYETNNGLLLNEITYTPSKETLYDGIKSKFYISDESGLIDSSNYSKK
jgi:guanylate kinase